MNLHAKVVFCNKTPYEMKNNRFLSKRGRVNATHPLFTQLLFHAEAAKQSRGVKIEDFYSVCLFDRCRDTLNRGIQKLLQIRSVRIAGC